MLLLHSRNFDCRRKLREEATIAEYHTHSRNEQKSSYRDLTVNSDISISNISLAKSIYYSLNYLRQSIHCGHRAQLGTISSSRSSIVLGDVYSGNQFTNFLISISLDNGSRESDVTSRNKLNAGVT